MSNNLIVLTISLLLSGNPVWSHNADECGPDQFGYFEVIRPSEEVKIFDFSGSQHVLQIQIKSKNGNYILITDGDGGRLETDISPNTSLVTRPVHTGWIRYLGGPPNMHVRGCYRFFE